MSNFLSSVIEVLSTLRDTRTFAASVNISEFGYAGTAAEPSSGRLVTVAKQTFARTLARTASVFRIQFASSVGALSSRYRNNSALFVSKHYSVSKAVLSTFDIGGRMVLCLL